MLVTKGNAPDEKDDGVGTQLVVAGIGPDPPESIVDKLEEGRTVASSCTGLSTF